MQQHSLSGRSVCVVDDDELVRKAMSFKLREFGVVALEAATGSDLLTTLEREHVDCILLDYNLATENGLFVQDQLRQRFVEVPPVIMLSASDNQRTIIKAFRTGVYDYLIKKNLGSEELMQSLMSAIQRRAATVSSKAEVERLRSQSNVDETTGLFRQDAIRGMLQELVDAPAQSRKPFFIIMLRLHDADGARLKVGQVVWKRVVGMFSARLRKMMRSSDACGHDEAGSFIYVVDTAITPHSADILADRMSDGLSFDVQEEAETIHVVPELGIARFPQDGADLPTLLKVALDNVAPRRSPPSQAPGDTVGEVAPNTTERRQFGRQRVFKGAKVIVNSGHALYDCTIRDLSPKGARIRLNTAFTAPDTFDLRIAGSGKDAHCRVVWQRGDEIGVEFSR